MAILAIAPACKREEQMPGGSENKGTKPVGKGAAPAADDIPAPPDVKAPPADAEKKDVDWQGGKVTLSSKRLQKGTGTDHPAPQDRVKVNYTGWTTDGKMFDSSVKRGQPATFALRGVIPGWTEGLQLMTVGEKRRFWIPEELAYKGRPGKPQGTLVFDVELLEIIPGPKPIPLPEGISAAVPPKDAVKDKSGLVYKIEKPGDGKSKPSAKAYTEFHFTAWSSDGTMIDSTVQRNRTLNIPVDKGIPAWKEMLPQMTKGEKRLVWANEDMAFKGRPGSKGGLTLFELELVSYVEPPAAPADVKAPPQDAKCEDVEATGAKGKVTAKLCWKILTPGKQGDKHPTEDDTVEVHYTGWTTDGKMFDSSVTRGKPARFPLKGVIPGWTKGVPKLALGDKARLWIPEELAYAGQPGAPAGMLVFDIELLQIMPPPAPPPGMAPDGGGATPPPAGGGEPAGHP
jgi:FKBP-type peptidyl-prolyl cis-trans isomerase